MMTIEKNLGLQVALVQPEIAPNTGNIGRLCVATGAKLHLIRPLGFVLNEPTLRRSGMDYWERLNLTIHDDLEAFLAAKIGRLWLFSSKGQLDLWDVKYERGDCLVFGSETKGLPKGILERFPQSVVRIPQVEDERCLNLSTAAGVALYEAVRQVR